MKRSKVGRPRKKRCNASIGLKLRSSDVAPSLPAWLQEMNEKMVRIGFPTEKRYLCLSDMRLGVITLLHLARRWCLINEENKDDLMSPRDLFLYLERWCENTKENNGC